MALGIIHHSVSGAIITSSPPAHSSDIPIKETPSRPSRSRSRSLGSIEQVEKDNTFHIERDAECGPPVVFPERKVKKVKEEEEKPAYSMVIPPKISHLSATTPDPPKKTLGRLFTDGGLEDFLIRVVRCADRRDLASCLLVCKNTNAVMVKSTTIQTSLRSHLFSLGCLPIPSRYQAKETDYPDAATSPFNNTSKQAVEAMMFIHRCLENSVYTNIRPRPIPLGTCKPEDVQAGTILLTHEAGWSVIADMETSRLVRRDWPTSELALCAEDKVVVEARGHIMSLGNDDVRHKLVRARFMSASLAGNPDGSSPKHPDAKFERVTVHVADNIRINTDHEPIKMRLYPGGLAAVLLAGAHDCGAKCSDSTLPSTRLVVFNWHNTTGLGVLRLPDTTVKILDFQFLHDLQIICSSIRSINGYTYPCIDVYDIAQNHIQSDDNGMIPTHLLLELSLMSSVRFPRLVASQPGCVWTQSSKTTSQVARFDLKVSNPSKLTAVHDQVMTFQLDGRVGKKFEKLQGVILLSRLRQIMLDAIEADQRVSRTDKIGNAWSRSGSEGPKSKCTSTNLNPIVESPPPIGWEKWSSAVSFSHKKWNSVLEPRCTQIANLARSRKDKTHAVLMIRDYNQRILLAPPGYMHRNLGHPTENEFTEPMEDEPQSTVNNFKLVSEVKSIKSILFGQTVKYGLDHRLRMVDLGVFARNTTLSRVCGNSPIMSVFTDLPNDQYEMYMFGFLFEPDHQLAESFEQQLSGS